MKIIMYTIDSTEELKVGISVHIPWLLENDYMKTLKLGKNQVMTLIQRLEQSVDAKKQNPDVRGVG